MINEKSDMISAKLFPIELGFTKPNPSLCDSCIFASKVGGGSVSIGHETYEQRYCPKPPIGKEGTLEGRAIHADGYQECEYYKKRNDEG
jgi:hypothetical protein